MCIVKWQVVSMLAGGWHCPTQMEGKTACGALLFVRYRAGRLWAELEQNDVVLFSLSVSIPYIDYKEDCESAEWPAIKAVLSIWFDFQVDPL
jgi:hypothetical protein